MTFNWDDNEIRASQFLVDKAMEMAKTIARCTCVGDAKKPGTLATT